MALSQQLIHATKEHLSSLGSEIPSTLYGIEKQKYISREIIKRLPGEQLEIFRMLVNNLLFKMRDVHASDMEIGGWATRNMIWLRIHGSKRPIPEFGKFENDEFNILIQSLLGSEQRDILFENRNLDFSYTAKTEKGQKARYRADAYFDLDDLALNMRAISSQIRPYENFRFHNNVTNILSLAGTKDGLILVTGITGSGKSTTLDSIVDLNNRTVDGHIVIISAPIEFVHQSKKCIIRHREVGSDTLSFKDGTIEALRQDPDIIIIGEMRDPDTIMAALEVADSGHKVLSTLHTSSSVESIDRIIAEVPPQEQDRVKNRLADILRCIISQKLVPNFKGTRILAKEIMLMTPSIKAAIKNNNISEIYQMISESSKYGMITMEQDLKRLFMERQIKVETAMSFSNNKRRMKQLLNQA
jgi:twitching motility protein PilT